MRGFTKTSSEPSARSLRQAITHSIANSNQSEEELFLLAKLLSDGKSECGGAVKSTEVRRGMNPPSTPEEIDSWTVYFASVDLHRQKNSQSELNHEMRNPPFPQIPLSDLPAEKGHASG